MMRRLVLVLLACACSSKKPAPPADAPAPVKAVDAAVDAASIDALVVDAPVTGELSRVVELALFANGGCARRTDGHVRCWGGRGPGTPPQTVPLEVPGLDDAIALDADTLTGELTLVRGSGDVVHWKLAEPEEAPTPLVRAEPEIVDARAHGANLYTLTRTNDLVHRANGEARKIAGDVIALDRMRGGTIVALDRDGAVLLLAGAKPPRKVRGLTDANALVGGNCARRRTDELTCWDASGKPTAWKGPTNIVDRRGACDLTRSGVACATSGGGAKVLTLPAKPTAIDAGSRFACALLSSGEVACWGHNEVGQLGDGTLVDREAPAEVAGLTSPEPRTLAGPPALPVASQPMDWSGLPEGCTRPSSLALGGEPVLASVVSAYAYPAGPGGLRVVLADFMLEPTGYPRDAAIVRGDQRAVELVFAHAERKKPKAVDRGLYRATGARTLTVHELVAEEAPRARATEAVIEKIEGGWVCGQLLDRATPAQRQPFAARLAD